MQSVTDKPISKMGGLITHLFDPRACHPIRECNQEHEGKLLDYIALLDNNKHPSDPSRGIKALVLE